MDELEKKQMEVFTELAALEKKMDKRMTKEEERKRINECIECNNRLTDILWELRKKA